MKLGRIRTEPSFLPEQMIEVALPVDERAAVAKRISAEADVAGVVTIGQRMYLLPTQKLERPRRGALQALAEEEVNGG